ncbi:MAG: hypothetical protein IPI95_08685 [Flavobacteriales bacterium]|nr:hypothetical protein [Flavobacteriales bacterium]
MKKAATIGFNLYFMALAMLFSSLLLSTAVLPTVMSVSYGRPLRHRFRLKKSKCTDGICKSLPRISIPNGMAQRSVCAKDARQLPPQRRGRAFRSHQ